MSKQQFLTSKQFLRLSKSKRAVIIAKDVIEQIKKKLYKPNHTYSTTLKGKKGASDDADAAELLRTQEIKCEGCARASLFISAVKYKNRMTIETVEEGGFHYEPEMSSNGNSIVTDYLSEEFSRDQQVMIESAYEGRKGFGDNLFTDDERFYNSPRYKSFEKRRDVALEFNKKALAKWKTLNRETRGRKDDYVLTQICKNIVKNEGVFKP